MTKEKSMNTLKIMAMGIMLNWLYIQVIIFIYSCACARACVCECEINAMKCNISLRFMKFYIDPCSKNIEKVPSTTTKGMTD